MIGEYTRIEFLQLITIYGIIPFIISSAIMVWYDEKYIQKNNL